MSFMSVPRASTSPSATRRSRSGSPASGRVIHDHGGAPAGPWPAAWFFVLTADRRPLPSRVRLEIQRPELVHAEDHLWFAGLGDDLTVGDRVQVLDAGLLDRIVGVGGGFPGFQPLKGDAFLAEQHPQALMADVVDDPLSDQELGQLVQAPGRKRQAMLSWPGLGELPGLPPLARRELRRPPACVLRVPGAEPVGVEVTDHIADPILAGERHLRDPGHVHALGRQQHHLRPPPGHTDPLSRRTIRTSRRPSSSSISRTRRRSIGPVWRIGLCRQCAPPANMTLQRH